jgi:hypothetical protein
VEWGLISKRTPARGEKEPVVFQSEKISLTVPAGEEVQKSIKAKTMVFSDKTVTRTTGEGSSSNRTRSGDVYAGYVVIVRSGGEILAQDASTSRYLKEDWIAKLQAGAPKPAARKK